MLNEIPSTYCVYLCQLHSVKRIETKRQDTQISNGLVLPIVNVHEQGTLPIEQVYLTTCLEGEIKGPHCHRPNKHDRFYCVSGKVAVVCRSEKTDKIQEFILTELGDFYLEIPPYNSHAIINIGHKPAVVLSMPSQGYREGLPYNQIDTTYEGYDWGKWTDYLR